MDDAKAQNALDSLQDVLDWQAAEIERLKDVIREQDRIKGTTTARLSMRLDPVMICLTCPTVDERKVAGFLFAGVAQWMMASAMSTLQKTVGVDEASALMRDAWENPTPAPSHDKP